MSSLSRVVEAETGIPLSVQHHFAAGEYDGTNENWGEGRERETVALDDAWILAEDREEGLLFLHLVTTAFRLREIFRLDGGQDRMVTKMLLWRHHVASLRYLRNAKDRDPEEQKRQDLEGKIEEYERLEKASSNEVRSLFSDWDRLICGVEKKRTRNGDNESMETRKREIEARFTQFWQEKKHLMEKLSSQQNEAGGGNESEIDPKSATNDPKQSDLETPTAGYSKSMKSRMTFDFAPTKEEVVTKPLRSDSDGFTLRSGVLLWGQLHTVFA